MRNKKDLQIVPVTPPYLELCKESIDIISELSLITPTDSSESPHIYNHTKKLDKNIYNMSLAATQNGRYTCIGMFNNYLYSNVTTLMRLGYGRPPTSKVSD